MPCSLVRSEVVRDDLGDLEVPVVLDRDRRAVVGDALSRLRRRSCAARSSKTSVTAMRASRRRTGDSLASGAVGGSAHPPGRFVPMADRVLVVTAHPDDVDFGAAGTVAAWTDEGLDVVYCIVTDGEAGGSDRVDEPCRHGRRSAARSRPLQRRCSASPSCTSSVILTAGCSRRSSSAVTSPCHPCGAAATAAHPVASTQLPAHLREPSRSPRLRRGARCAPCTPTRATRSRFPTLSARGSSRGRCPRSG